MGRPGGGKKGPTNGKAGLPNPITVEQEEPKNAEQENDERCLRECWGTAEQFAKARSRYGDPE